MEDGNSQGCLSIIVLEYCTRKFILKLEKTDGLNCLLNKLLKLHHSSCAREEQAWWKSEQFLDSLDGGNCPFGTPAVPVVCWEILSTGAAFPYLPHTSFFPAPAQPYLLCFVPGSSTLSYWSLTSRCLPLFPAGLWFEPHLLFLSMELRWA